MLAPEMYPDISKLMRMNFPCKYSIFSIIFPLVLQRFYAAFITVESLRTLAHESQSRSL